MKLPTLKMPTLRMPALVARDDTFFGVCQGIGEDFRFNPLWLRLAFTAGLFLYPLQAVSVYALLGAVVAVSRWFAPLPRVAEDAEPQPVAEPATETLPLAA